MRELRGIAASPGTALAPAYLFIDDYSSAIPSFSISSEEVESEYGRFLDAITMAKADVVSLRDKALKVAGE